MNTALRAWPAHVGPRLAGVSSFGLGGTNAHVIVEQAVAQPVSGPSRDWQLLVLSARTPAALEAAADRLATALASSSGVALADVAYTLQTGRSAMPHRRAIVCRDLGDAVRSLRMKSSATQAVGVADRREPSCVLMFSGQGAQYVGMAAELYRDEPTFRADVDACCDLLKPHLDRDLREVMFADGRDAAAAELLKQTAYTQPALFVVEYAVARLWLRWGIKPAAFIGHSVGEYVAACLAGVFALGDALPLVAARGRLIQQLPAGAMLAVSAAEAAILPLLEPGVSIAAVNAPTLVVLSGPNDTIDRQAIQLEAVGIAARRLETSHAFHSSMMEPALDAFRALVAAVPRGRPRIRIVSNLTGDWLSDEQAASADYWVQHLRQPVRFAAGIERLRQSPHAYIEVGPGRTLATFVRQAAPAGDVPPIVTSLRHPQESHADLDGMLRGVARLWTAGVAIDWNAYWSGEQRRRVELPSYPFERQKFAFAARPRVDAAKPAAAKRRPLADWFSVPSWKRMPGSQKQGSKAPGTSWLLFADPSGLAARLGSHLATTGQHVVMVEMGASFEQLASDHYVIDPGAPQDYRRLLEALRSSSRMPAMVGHFWSATDDVSAAAATDDDQQRRGFLSLLYLAQALGDLGTDSPLHLAIVTTGLVEVTGDERVNPVVSTVLGPLRVIPQEYPNVSCRAVDLVASEWQSPDERRLSDLASVLTGTHGDAVIAYRGTHQWVPTIEQASFDAAQPGLSNLREHGVYLITGGYGGIGLSLATYLAQGFRARVALVGRTGVPARETWPEILAQPPEDSRVVRQIETIQELEAAGAEVLPLIGDVTVAAQMRAVVQQALDTWGRIDGVVHAAGVPGGGVIQLKRPEVAASVMAPKIAGTRALAEALNGVALDFFVLCSSTTALRGGGGQVDYCSANAFLDSFAREHARRTGTMTVAINWDAWREVGMAVETGVPVEVMRRRAAALKDAIAPNEGAEAFARIVAQATSPQVIVSPFAFVTQPAEEARAASDADSPAAAETVDGAGYERPDLETAFEAPRNEVEERVAAIWQQMFGIARIGVADDFFALGGHSLLATQVISRTRAEFQISLALEDLFTAPTIAGLSDLVLARLIEEEEGGLADIEELSADQVGQELRLGGSRGESDS